MNGENFKFKSGNPIKFNENALVDYLNNEILSPIDSFCDLLGEVENMENVSLYPITDILLKNAYEKVQRFVDAIEKSIGKIEICHSDFQQEGDIHRGIERIEEETIVAVKLNPIKGDEIFIPIKEAIEWIEPDIEAQKELSKKYPKSNHKAEFTGQG